MNLTAKSIILFFFSISSKYRKATESTENGQKLGQVQTFCQCGHFLYTQIRMKPWRAKSHEYIFLNMEKDDKTINHFRTWLSQSSPFPWLFYLLQKMDLYYGHIFGFRRDLMRRFVTFKMVLSLIVTMVLPNTVFVILKFQKVLTLIHLIHSTWKGS